jgi:hypothetical protein
MPTYEIGGKTFETDGPLSDADIDHIAGQQAAPTQRPAPPPGPPSDSPGLDPYAPGFDADAYKKWQDANPNALTEFGKSVARGVDTTATGTANLLRTLRADTTNNPETAQHAREMRDASMNEYKKRMADNPAEVPSYSDIKNAHDVSMYVADKLGGMSKYIASYFAGGLPGIMGTGAIDAGTQEATNPDATPTSVMTAGGLGAATGAIPVPFLKAGGGIVSKTVKDALGMGLLGTAQGLTGNIPRAVATGDPSQGLPTKEQIIDSALGGVIGGGTFGAIHGAANQLTAGAPPTRLPPDAPPQKHADARLSERLSDAAEQNDYNVKKVAYDAGNGAKAVADIVHGDVSSGISGFWNDIKSTMPDPTDVGEREQLNRLDSIIKNAKTKVKARVSDDDLQFLTDRVGHTEEGRALVDLVRQSNSLTDLFKTGFKGGVSRYTDFLNPLGRGGAENGYYSSLTRALPGGAGKLVELAALYHNPALAVPMAAGVAMGRGIDALTGNRSTVSRFINDNSLAPQPVDMTGASSILRARAEYEAAQDAQATQAQQRGTLQKASDQFDKQQEQANQSSASRSVRRNSAPRTGSTTTPAWAASTSQFTTRPASVLTTPSLVSSSCSVPGASRQTSSTASSRSPATSWQVTLATTSSTCWTRWPATASSSATPSGRHQLLRRLILHKLGQLAVSRLCTTIRQHTRLRPLAIKPASQRRWIVLLSRITRHTRNRGSTTLLRLSRGPTTAKTPPRSARTSYTRFNTRPRPRPQLVKSWTRWSHRSSTPPRPCGPLPPSVIAVAGPLPESV